MAKKSSIFFIICVSFLFLEFAVIPLQCEVTEDGDDHKTYIIYMGSLPKVSSSSSYSPSSHHLSILKQVIYSGGNEIDATSSLVRSYKRSFNGFAAKLTSDQRDEIAQIEGVVSVFESKTLHTQTTRSWDFMGFVENVKATKRNLSAESEVIVGVIDTGIWPESESFSDENFGDVPKKWKGTCAGGINFICNKKIIGARYYGTGDSTRDLKGHGTHTASIAAGNIIHDASFYEIAKGTVRGGAPSARIASYAACLGGSCAENDVLAAFDDAIADGVTLISISLGNSKAYGFADDVLTIGAFHAMERGILTVQSAGNDGPGQGSVSSVAPWILTVAASSTDRQIIDKLVLGNGQTIMGNSINSFASNGSKFPIVAKLGGSKKCPRIAAENCYCFDKDLVKGKIVLCPALLPHNTAKSHGVVGVITPKEMVSLPSLAISSRDHHMVSSYANSTENPKAEILKSEAIKGIIAPIVVNFSSRGPNRIVPEILKPDISAPGVEILAAFSPVGSVSHYDEDKRSVKYNILSGTSMSCPHVSGISAYLKSRHPDWSPAAIKSAILTTAKPMKKSFSFDLVGEFEYGSGHVNPLQADDPGLVYDISKHDYLEMLCNLGLNASNVKLISGENYICPTTSHRDLVKNLNYPSLAAKVEALKPFKLMFNRTVTNVGFAKSIYKVSVLPNSKANITVEPEILSFKSLNEKKSFVVTIFGVIPLQCEVTEDGDDHKTYIIYMGSLSKVSPSSSYSPTSHHIRILKQVIYSGGNETDATSFLIRSYKRSFNGFAAKLTSDQRDKIAQIEGVVSVFESITLHTQTTRSWDLMGFVENVTATKRNSSAESEVIVGVIDTGIWPESESFSDENFGDVPKKWRGTCSGGKNFTCNKKIIGARYYGNRDSARDIYGHGTHTASIAAGNIVHNASFYGIAQGVARGGVPSARIASYAACLGRTCNSNDILAAFDDAISDGVDLISISLGFSEQYDFAQDPIAIGAFHAMERGILTVQSAGNRGPDPATISSIAPWILTVAASSTDRKIIDKLVLGNGHTIIGNSVNSFVSNGSKFPIATQNGGSSTNCSASEAESCVCFDTDLVKGKIILCPRPLRYVSIAKLQGVVGIITIPGGDNDDWSNIVPLPSLPISSMGYNTIKYSYMNSTKDPKAEILKSEAIQDLNAPSVVKFSSRGPNVKVPEILKPDISAPGVEILAAYSPVASVSDYGKDKRSVRYNILSGTSMSCPHVSGVAAYLKSLHPDWSPAAIKSAILTTAKPMKKSYSGDSVGEFEYGSGHLNPIQAGDPGLVYDISNEDYLEMLCNLGLNASDIKLISGGNYTCPSTSHRDLVKNLNYPSLGAKVEALKPFNVMFKRTVTNVGFPNSIYKASVLPNLKINITVDPSVLSFKSLNEKKSFVVTIIAEGPKRCRLAPWKRPLPLVGSTRLDFW
ncbi:cucumisin-like protein [Senna tora]|uniref:Cucumisin-like protein n=1 Tax=Senna tora TaxID=362788 RepID=A0A834WV84_9FABA|nr:cucumisin-like protein [Senna tora]